jgi:hypothetical protein
MPGGRCSLELLVNVHGTTEPLILAHGFIDRMLARLARAGSKDAAEGAVVARGRMSEHCAP